jgi:hypothetical protein
VSTDSREVLDKSTKNDREFTQWGSSLESMSDKSRVFSPFFADGKSEVGTAYKTPEKEVLGWELAYPVAV